MQKIRNGVFETNSSSTHSLCICDNQMMNDWVHGNKVLYVRDGQFYDTDSIDEDRRTMKLPDVCRNNINNVDCDVCEKTCDFYDFDFPLYLTWENFKLFSEHREVIKKSYRGENGIEVNAYSIYMDE